MEVSRDFEDFFVLQHDEQVKLRHKDVFVRRIAGLCSSIELDLRSSQLMPELLPMEVT